MPRTIIVGYIVPLSILLPIIIFLFKYRYAPKAFKLLFYFLIAAAVINSAALVVVNKGMRNLPLLHLYTIVESVFFLLYFKAIFKEKTIKKVITIMMVAFVIVSVVNSLFIQNLFTFNTHTRPLEAIIITVLCLMHLFKSDFAEDWLKQPVNWINIGILVYFPVAMVIFTLSNYFTFIKTELEMIRRMWDLHAILVLLMYVIWAKGFSLIKKSKDKLETVK
ncbi:MAG: hypothetical protein EOO43_10765 [Flavobacterium sp.]|nr:MAG: hypothetical protein EOO43_10765 [Flavobacterium sp.]